MVTNGCDDTNSFLPGTIAVFIKTQSDSARRWKCCCLTCICVWERARELDLCAAEPEGNHERGREPLILMHSESPEEAR